MAVKLKREEPKKSNPQMLFNSISFCVNINLAFLFVKVTSLKNKY